MRPRNFDAIIIGAGVSGLYQLYKLRELGLKVRVLEDGDAIGGTWYWNRYPGARFDSESWTYGYSFSKELLEEWHWVEHFSPQPETTVSELWWRTSSICVVTFSAAAVSAPRITRRGHAAGTVMLEDGRRYSTRLLITAIGVLSAPTMPRIPGVETFRGPVLPHPRFGLGNR